VLDSAVTQSSQSQKLINRSLDIRQVAGLTQWRFYHSIEAWRTRSQPECMSLKQRKRINTW